jgi:hypothetical protein
MSDKKKTLDADVYRSALKKIDRTLNNSWHLTDIEQIVLVNNLLKEIKDDELFHGIKNWSLGK